MNNILNMCQRLKKRDLHLHLNGLFNTNLVKNILREEKTIIPKGFNIDKDLNILSSKDKLVDYFLPWKVLRLIPKNNGNLSLLVRDGFKALAMDNIEYVEIRSSVIYLSKLQKKSLEDTLLLLLDELKNAAIQNKVKFSMIFTIQRDDSSLDNLKKIINAFENIGKPKEIVGLDLAGDEDYHIPKAVGQMFKKNKDKHGLKITVHAGETGKINNIYEAINDFGADRIGHGLIVGKCLQTMELLVKKDMCLEICPISNKRTGAVKPHEKHPVNTLIDNKVPFVICSDNPGIHNLTLSYDYFEFYKETKRFDIIETIYSMQKKYSFV